jgi:hypothetical protein
MSKVLLLSDIRGQLRTVARVVLDCERVRGLVYALAHQAVTGQGQWGARKSERCLAFRLAVGKLRQKHPQL